ncbi:uncharacterized protein LOC113777177 [Coffea eugenioides]|uniref:uncharacterized protein LOC113777177 n=1 Tax=Coffea eugenioides TaxID=49369 RepID=UPI000F5D14D8|nr:uncharacterized protein LOC113700782 [Coffea arabica]XP_027178018.1 uncharacterized protein LOC113777177 [Coffea eugenioides]
MVICWSLWKIRNQVLFQEGLLSVQRVIGLVDSFLMQLVRAKVFRELHFRGNTDCKWFRYVVAPLKVSKRSISVSWLKPPLGTLKLNSDASMVEGVASGGGLIRNHEGNLIFTFYKEFGVADVLLAEGLALLHGLQLYKEKGYSSFHTEVDSESLASLVKEGTLTKWLFCNVLLEIRSLLVLMNSGIRHIFREANLATDRMTALRVGQVSFISSTSHLPVFLRSVLALDSRSFPYVRSQRVRE